MSWSAITGSDVESALSGPELEAYRRVAGTSAGANDDKLAAVIAQVTDEIRSHIEDCPENRLGAAGMLPERCHFHAVVMVRQRLMNRLGLKINESRETEHKNALRFFERVSECKVKIESPDAGDVVTEAPLPQIETITGNVAQASREKLKGLY